MSANLTCGHDWFATGMRGFAPVVPAGKEELERTCRMPIPEADT